MPSVSLRVIVDQNQLKGVLTDGIADDYTKGSDDLIKKFSIPLTF